MAFWDDLYIYAGQQHYMDYSLCGDTGRRTVTFDWRMGRYAAPSNGPLYSFSATFFEDQPSRVQLTYFGTTDQGNSASVGMQGTTNGQRKCKIIHLMGRVANIFRIFLQTLRQSGHYQQWSSSNL
jgi:hypothetical protein